MAHHELIASTETVHWGYYDAKIPPILEIESGDTVTFHIESGWAEARDIYGHRVSQALGDIFDNCRRGGGGHILVGPVAVKGAEPGDVLEVRIKEIALRYDWGYNSFSPLKGGVPEDFPYSRTVIVNVDKEAGVGDWGAGVKVPLRPFFGHLGVAPPPAMGEVPSIPPGIWGGNLDNKELIAGATVYLPVHNAGAQFSTGDGHGCQGDGEACVSALETALIGTFEIILRKDLRIEVPRAETDTHYIAMGFDPVLDSAVKMALREAIKFLSEEKGLSRDDAYSLCSLAVDLRVTQIVNGIKGAHAMIPKEVFA